MENCRSCGTEIIPDITNPLALCDDCLEVSEELCNWCEEPVQGRMFENPYNRSELVEHIVCVNGDCGLYCEIAV